MPDSDATPDRADIVVALTTYNDARTIGPVIRAVIEGLARAFAPTRARIVIADAGSSDPTMTAAREAAGAALVEVDVAGGAFGEVPYHGHPGRAPALKAALAAAARMEARACAVLDPGLARVDPAWIERLIGPVLADGIDYVSPYYLRHVTEGAITKGIVYPAFRALYGARLRQPAATEFGCSGRLVAHYLEQDFWDAEHATSGIDLWLAVEAVCGEFRVAESILGTRGPSRHTTVDLSTALAQVVGALFSELDQRSDEWQRVRGSTATPVFGVAEPLAGEEPALNVDALVESFRLGYRELREIWTWVLPPRTILELRKLADAPRDRLRFDDRLWAAIIYDFAVGQNLRVMPRDHLLRSLTPLYSAWLASFVLQMRGAGLEAIDARIEQVAAAFESEKRNFVSRWRWPERLR